MRFDSTRSWRRAYSAWVEEQIEAFKESIPRADLLGIADEVVRELAADAGGQCQLTELLLCDAVDSHLFHRLGLPSYRSWLSARRAVAQSGRGISQPGRVTATQEVEPPEYTPFGAQRELAEVKLSVA